MAVLVNLSAQRSAWQTAIRLNPITLNFYNSNLVEDGAGGFRESLNTTGTDVQVRLARPTIPRAPQFKATETGETTLDVILLMAMYNASIELDDKFTWENREYAVREYTPKKYKGEIVGKHFRCEVVL